MVADPGSPAEERCVVDSRSIREESWEVDPGSPGEKRYAVDLGQR